MKLVVISHKLCWRAPSSPLGYVTDGGFPIQMAALSELFDETAIVVPVASTPAPDGTIPLAGYKLHISPLSAPMGTGIKRRFFFFFWLLRNSPTILKRILEADAVHTPIPGDIGTIGMLIAFFLRKPLFVRHCGNWENQRTTAEKFWRWFMERFAGGRNVFLATGGAITPPSAKNANIKWIFSTSLTKTEIATNASPRKSVSPDSLCLIAVGRLEEGKNLHLLIESLPYIQKAFPRAQLKILGDGSEMGKLTKLAATLGITQSVCFYGRVEHSAVLDLLHAADIFCFPTNSEGFPKAVLEALVCGLPVITTHVSALPLLIEGNQCGIVLRELTSRTIADAVCKIVQDQQAYCEMSLRAVETAKAYSLENWRDTLGSVLKTQWGRCLREQT